MESSFDVNFIYDMEHTSSGLHILKIGDHTPYTQIYVTKNEFEKILQFQKMIDGFDTKEIPFQYHGTLYYDPRDLERISNKGCTVKIVMEYGMVFKNRCIAVGQISAEELNKFYGQNFRETG